MKTWRIAWQAARFRPAIFGISFVLWVLFLSLPLATGLISRAFFDALTGQAQATTGVWTLLALLVGTEGMRIAVILIFWVAYLTFWHSTEALLRKNMLGWLMQGPGARTLPGSSGEVVSRFREDVEEVLIFIDTWLDSTGLLVFTAAALVIMVRINPAITFVVFLPLAGIVAVTHMMGTRIRRYRTRSREATSRVTGFIGEMFGAVQAIKVASAERRVIDYFRALNTARSTAALKDRLFTEMLDSFNMNTVNLGLGLILLLAAQAMQTDTFTVGDFSLFASYLGSVTAFPRWISRLMARYKQAGVSIERMAKLLEGAPEETLVKHGPIYFQGDLPDVPYTPKSEAQQLETLEAVGLTYHYPGTQRGIEEINLCLKRGTFTVITGRIGAGKTTLLRTLLGLLPRESGEIRWNGQRVDDPATFLVPPRSAYTPQVPRLFSEPLKDNVLMGLPEERVDLAGAIRLAVMEQDLEGMEDGLETVVGPKGVRLSGGQVQRTAAARMFVRDAELLVFDDLSSALDVETEKTLWERLRARGPGDEAEGRRQKA
ncbi:MAG: ABC transporter ATP-binding protein/permease, partial [Chloroflexota bacterium]|nr:ABC transporter ATP-binding protein/permease [Chloroflexota bacterium]